MAIDLNDKSGNSNTLTNSGAAEVTASLPFAASTIAADFEAADPDYMEASDSTSLSITGDVTIEFWVKFESTPSSGNAVDIVSKSTTTGDQRSYRVGLINNAGTLQLFFAYSTDGTFQAGNDVRKNWSPSTATWYHVAIVFDASVPDVTYYVDTVAQGSPVSGSGTSLFNSSSALRLGNNPEGGAALDGVLDEVRVWNTERTSTQIADNYNLELAGNETGLVAYWPFEATIATTTSTSSSTTTTSTSTSTSSTTSTSSSTTTTSTSTTTTSTSITTTSTSITTTSTTDALVFTVEAAEQYGFQVDIPTY
jgi:hypothetical protein